MGPYRKSRLKNNLTVGLFLTLLVVPPMAGTAGPEKISFPPYQDHVLYAVVDRVDIKEVRDLYFNRESARVVKPGQPLPSGTVITMVHFKAQVNDKGELIKDPNGRLVKGELNRIGVMETRMGWGGEYPEALRNGEWEYALFRPDGSRNETANVKGCFECHKPEAKRDFVFTFERLTMWPK